MSTLRGVGGDMQKWDVIDQGKDGAGVVGGQ